MITDWRRGFLRRASMLLTAEGSMKSAPFDEISDCSRIDAWLYFSGFDDYFATAIFAALAGD